MAVRVIESYNNLPDWFIKYLNRDRQLKDTLSSKNIDLANVTYIPDKLPSSARDPKLKDPKKIPVFNINGKIYVVGYSNPFISINGRWDNARKFPMKTIIANADEYGYLDATVTNVDIRNKRRQAKQGVEPRGAGQYHYQKYHYENDPEISWKSIKVPDEWVWLQTKGQDKSGYKLDPDKYKKMLDNVGLDTYSARLQRYYDIITELKKELANLISRDLSILLQDSNRSIFANNLFSAISQTVSNLGRAVDYYKYIERDINELIHKLNDGDSYVNNDNIDKFIANAFRNNAKSLRDHIDDVRKDIKYYKSIVDKDPVDASEF